MFSNVSIFTWIFPYVYAMYVEVFHRGNWMYYWVKFSAWLFGFFLFCFWVFFVIYWTIVLLQWIIFTFVGAYIIRIWCFFKLGEDLLVISEWIYYFSYRLCASKFDEFHHIRSFSPIITIWFFRAPCRWQSII